MLNHIVCAVPRPLNGSEAGGDLDLRQTWLLLLCKSNYSNANYVHLHDKCKGLYQSEVTFSLPWKGRVTKQGLFTLKYCPWYNTLRRLKKGRIFLRCCLRRFERSCREKRLKIRFSWKVQYRKNVFNLYDLLFTSGGFCSLMNSILS